MGIISLQKPKLNLLVIQSQTVPGSFKEAEPVGPEHYCSSPYPKVVEKDKRKITKIPLSC